jgi:hypothetical protein
VPLALPRLQSPPFSYTLPPTNNLAQLFGIPISGTVAPAVSDGYWSTITGLPPGNYVVAFGGQIPLTATTTFTEIITYKITVTP